MQGGRPSAEGGCNDLDGGFSEQISKQLLYMKFEDKRKDGLNNCREKKSQLRNGNYEDGNSRAEKYRNKMF